MSGESPLVAKIEGYEIKVINKNGLARSIALKLNKVGGAHVENPESLIQMIEDAVFRLEERYGDDT